MKSGKTTTTKEIKTANLVFIPQYFSWSVPWGQRCLGAVRDKFASHQTSAHSPDISSSLCWGNRGDLKVETTVFYFRQKIAWTKNSQMANFREGRMLVIFHQGKERCAQNKTVHSYAQGYSAHIVRKPIEEYKAVKEMDVFQFRRVSGHITALGGSDYNSARTLAPDVKLPWTKMAISRSQMVIPWMGHSDMVCVLWKWECFLFGFMSSILRCSLPHVDQMNYCCKAPQVLDKSCPINYHGLFSSFPKAAEISLSALRLSEWKEKKHDPESIHPVEDLLIMNQMTEVD